MSKINKIIYSIVLILLIGSNVFFATYYLKARKQSQLDQYLLSRARITNQNLDFMKIFIEKVLQTDEEVDFDTRLDLENKVRNLENEEILKQWNLFTKSSTESQAQVEVKKLLLLLIAESQKTAQ
jgi:hypothetical protein